MRTYRVRRGDRGAVLILVAVFAIVAIVMLAAVVDLGGLRQETREVTMSTDAAALAGASVADSEDTDLIAATTSVGAPCTSVSQSAANGGDPTKSVQVVVDDYLARNGGSVGSLCRVFRTSVGQGYVIVAAGDDVEFAFGGAVGANGSSVAGTSAARFDKDRGGGLRPIANCLTGSSPLDPTNTLKSIIDSAPLFPAQFSPARVITVTVEKLNPDDPADPCDNASGHFGQLDFADNGNGQGSCGNDPKPDTYCDYLENGWFEAVDEATSGDPGGNYGPGVRAEFQDLIDEVGNYWVPVYDTVVDCNGATKPAVCEDGKGTRFRVKYFAEVRLQGFCLAAVGDTATEATLGKKDDCRIEEDPTDKKSTRYNWLRYEVLRVLAFAPNTEPPATLDAALFPSTLCAVSSDVSGCT